MSLELPSCDDRPVWDVWLSMLWLPAVTVADELEIFETLAQHAATPAELAQRRGFDTRALEILLPMLTSLGFLVAHLGRYRVSDATRNFFLRKSPFYWGNVFVQQRRINPMHAAVRSAVTRKSKPAFGQSTEAPPIESWESGQVTLEDARSIAAFMQSHSLPAAIGAALRGDFSVARRLLDVGGGSGCFSIAFAQRYPQLHCTVMDLPTMCTVALEYIEAARVADRVDARPVDMFRDEWPHGYDAMFFSNIFHDWSAATCAQLAARASAALPSDGRIYVHEILLDDSGVAPRTAAAFSMLMLTGTRGQQFTFGQLRELLQGAGFVEVDVTATYGYYSLVSGRKP